MGELEDLTQRVALLEGALNALPSVGPALNTLTQSKDVHIGAVDPLADDDALRFSQAENAWINKSGSAATKSGYYTDTFATTTTFGGAFGGQLEWPSTLANGDALLDFTTPTIPTVTEDGLYTFDVTVFSSNTTDLWNVGLFVARGFTVLGGVDGSDTPTALKSLSLTRKLVTGDKVLVDVGGGASFTFALSAVVSKVA